VRPPVLLFLLLFSFLVPSRLEAQKEGKDLDRLLEEARRELAGLEAREKKEAQAREELRERLLETLLGLEKEERLLAKEVEKARLEARAARRAGEEASARASALASARASLESLLDQAAPAILSRTRNSLAALGSPSFLRARKTLEEAWKVRSSNRGEEGGALSLLEPALELALSEVREGARLCWTRGVFPGPRGPAVETPLLRAGLLGAAGPAGILVPKDETFRLVRPGGWFPGNRIQKALDRLEPRRAFPPLAFPLDVTGGLALAGLEAEKSLSTLFREGGPVMYFILLAGIMGLLITFLRGIGIHRERRRLDRLSLALPPLLEAGDLEEAARLCRKEGGAAGKALEACLQAAGLEENEAGRVLDQALLQGALSLERFLGTLAVLGTLAPFLGLLGTVTGMIRTFSALTAAAGGGGSTLLAGGIAEALITTEFGLVVAIPLVLFHSVLSGRAERVQADLEEAGARVALSTKKAVPSGRERGEG